MSSSLPSFHHIPGFGYQLLTPGSLCFYCSEPCKEQRKFCPKWKPSELATRQEAKDGTS